MDEREARFGGRERRTGLSGGSVHPRLPMMFPEEGGDPYEMQADFGGRAVHPRPPHMFPTAGDDRDAGQAEWGGGGGVVPSRPPLMYAREGGARAQWGGRGEGDDVVIYPRLR